jgi:putative addiction module component (TIGR02574 family)
MRNPLLFEIEQKTSLLSVEEREWLAGRLLSRITPAEMNDVDEAWVEEAEIRYAAWKDGKADAVAAEDVISYIRAELDQ